MADHSLPGVFEAATETAQSLQTSLPVELRKPVIGIICGSGLGGLVDSIHSGPVFEIAYADIPYFPKSTVTNAAGGLNAHYAVGDIVVLQDHLNLAGLVGVHPLRGPNEDSFGVRFPALSDAYDLELRQMAHRAWNEMEASRGTRRMHEGVYAFVGGPRYGDINETLTGVALAENSHSYETRAECRMLLRLGADLVGMSTVPEIVVARHCGLRVLALSLVTNMAVLDAGPQGSDVLTVGLLGKDMNRILEQGKANHEEVLEAGREAARDMQVML
ncbi:MAG: hypothetical protein M1827_005682 [Pycnora praestabilis]|nr:MAG: hypothetical protein M1827_005682 [Pycnora praestabilis]